MKKLPVLLFVMMLLLTTACTGQRGEEAYRFQSADLSGYTIVYAQDNPDYYDLANRLSDHIMQTYGIFLIPTSDDAAPVEKEILIGDTNRSTVQGRIMEYSVTVGDGKLEIHAGGSYSAQQAIDHLCQTLFTGREFALETGEYYQTSLLEVTHAVTDGTSARVMSANVLADAFADSSYATAGYRGEIFAGMLISYTPDAVGLQETDESWNEVLDGYLAKVEETCGIAYARFHDTVEGKVNYTSLLYRKDKYRVENSGVYVFNWWKDPAFHHSYHMRNISWAQLTPVESGQSFILANTHWSYRTEHSDSQITLSGSTAPIAVDELRTQCVEETDSYLTALIQENPQIPIVLTGDFNTSLPYFTESDWTPTSFRVVSEEAKETGVALSAVPSSGHFDHIFAAGSYTIRQYQFFKLTQVHDQLTDHPFVYADLSF